MGIVVSLLVQGNRALSEKRKSSRVDKVFVWLIVGYSPFNEKKCAFVVMVEVEGSFLRSLLFRVSGVRVGGATMVRGVQGVGPPGLDYYQSFTCFFPGDNLIDEFGCLVNKRPESYVYETVEVLRYMINNGPL